MLYLVKIKWYLYITTQKYFIYLRSIFVLTYLLCWFKAPNVIRGHQYNFILYFQFLLLLNKTWIGFGKSPQKDLAQNLHLARFGSASLYLAAAKGFTVH